MLSILTLLIILTLSILVTRIATVALTYTGLSRQSARFQARSAFTGVGFTTDESEKVVNHPVRRRILFLLMLLGNAGVVTVMSTLILSFIDLGRSQSIAYRVVILVTGLVGLWAVASSQWVDRHLSNLISWALRRYTDLDVRDYSAMLHLAGEYKVSEMQVEPEDWLADRSLKELKLRNEGVMVLGITRRTGEYVGAPLGATRINPYDTLMIYGRASALERLDRRKRGHSGDREHMEQVVRQMEIEQEDGRTDGAA